MDRIIFRQNTNDFMRFTDGQIVIMGDKEEADEEFTIERNSGSNPLMICLSYSNIGDKDTAIITEGDENGVVVGQLIYIEDDNFYTELNKWTESYIVKQVK